MRVQILSSTNPYPTLYRRSHWQLPRDFFSSWCSNNMSAFRAHRNIAYRFLSPAKIASAIDISVTAEACVFTRLFLIFRGLSDDEVGMFAGAGEKEANTVNWREVVGWSENSKDPEQFRVLETTILEVTWTAYPWALTRYPRWMYITSTLPCCCSHAISYYVSPLTYMYLVHHKLVSDNEESIRYTCI